MTGFSKEMQDALKADAAKLSAMTGEDHTVEFFDFVEPQLGQAPCPHWPHIARLASQRSS